MGKVVLALLLICASALADERIVALGPWPPVWRPDPGNPRSGQPAAIALGERLFFDRRLSANGRLACASCHDPERGWGDGARVPSLDNVRLRVSRLVERSIRPIIDPGELRADAAHVAHAFDGLSLEAAGMALAAFLETLASPRTAFDRYRDALARGDDAAIARYPASAARGVRLFVGSAGCIACHAGPALGDSVLAPSLRTAHSRTLHRASHLSATESLELEAFLATLSAGDYRWWPLPAGRVR